MAKDATGKSVSHNSNNNNINNNSNSNSNNSNTYTTSPTSDQQKVPPLRIVLNTAGNQKSSSTSISVTQNQQQQSQQLSDSKREPSAKLPDNVKPDNNTNVLKSGGKVRIKLGTNKQQQQASKSVTSSESSSAQHQIEDAQKPFGKSTATVTDRSDSNFNPSRESKDDSTSNYSHLRRITRRSQRAVQALINEDEESISSMTSTDENQNTTNNNNSDTTNSQDIAINSIAPTAVPSSLNSAQTSVANNATSSGDGPRRYKRRKGETSECQLIDQEGLLSYQNYKLPNQNSFELYKNIRKQVDRKLKKLNTIHPKTPYGFKDYMLTRGAYLLDGNKLGNGTNLFMNEDGGLHPAPALGKYHALRHSRVSYSVPNRAKVPLGLPVNSPLYNLFIDQEKERYRMRMQHIKEREKLTLAAEQEIMRVYNQAAMAAANQVEPFSACTMLKHQEIYNYMDSDGVTIQAAEDVQQDLEADKQEGVRTRRRQHEHIAPPAPARKSNQSIEEKEEAAINEKGKETTASATAEAIDKEQNEKDSINAEKAEPKTPPTSDVTEPEKPKTSPKDDACNSGEGKELSSKTNMKEERSISPDSKRAKASVKDASELDQKCSDEDEKNEKNEEVKTEVDVLLSETSVPATNAQDASKVDGSQNKTVAAEEESVKSSDAKDSSRAKCEKENDESELDKPEQSQISNNDELNTSATTEILDQKTDQVVPMELDTNVEPAPQQDQSGVQNPAPNSEEVALGESEEHILSDDDRRAYNKEIFLSQLQDIDDKWEKIRNEMLVRHKNEAESLHAVQRLEWEWKTKEIGACDVRATPVIDNTLVPKLTIFSQDY